MTYDELKKHISTLLKSRRDVSLPALDEDIIPLVEQNMLYIANRYKVLGLVTNSANFRLLRALPDGYFIRMPKPPRNGTDHIDMDRELHMAIANFVAADLASSEYSRNIFKKNGRRIVKDYAFKLYNTPDPDGVA
ncbi:MAG: hypothetical protein AB7D34_01230 [Sulfurimonas sp.]